MGCRKDETLRTPQTVGGFDLCALAGVCIGGALSMGFAVVLDGLITSVAALAACEAIPEVLDYLLASHLGKEPAMAAILEELGLKPIILLSWRWGRNGSRILFPSFDMAYQVYRENADL